MKRKKFKVDIYDVQVEIVIVPDKFKTTEFYLKLIKRLKQPSEGNEPCEGFSFLYELKGWLVFAEDKLSHSLIHHEINHLGIKIFQFNNIPVEESEENFCLLTGFLADKVYNKINEIGCKII